ncbi:MAG TPA: Hsp20/alpha crystallin family protein [Desulfobulbus sp.]|nr:Hsp20/alpha crystallin family protein [Desulfobulbus sp.]
MATLTQLRQGLGQVWDTVIEGWNSLTRKATNAVTRFSLPGKAGKKDNALELMESDQRSIGWGLLAAEVFDSQNKIVVRIEAPGMKRSDFDIEVVDDILIIRGEKKIERESGKGRYHVVECAYGSFERAIALPAPVNMDKAKAKYRRGVLKIELPKQKKSQPRNLQIPIK